MQTTRWSHRPYSWMMSLATAALLVGCASGGGGGGGRDPLPVYFSADEVPCTYEVLRAVRGEARGLSRTFREEVIRVLGREGARVENADAVLADESAQGFVVVRRGSEGDRAGGIQPRRVSGHAIQFSPDCVG